MWNVTYIIFAAVLLYRKTGESAESSHMCSSHGLLLTSVLSRDNWWTDTDLVLLAKVYSCIRTHSVLYSCKTSYKCIPSCAPSYRTAQSPPVPSALLPLSYWAAETRVLFGRSPGCGSTTVYYLTYEGILVASGFVCLFILFCLFGFIVVIKLMC